MDSKRAEISGRAVSVRGNDIDTDRIIPARYLKCVTFEGLGEHSFEDDRSQLKEKGQTHAFDDPRFTEAKMLFVNKNFGCGSSREHAPQAIMRWGRGIEAIVGESFAEIFFGNCVALGIPCVTVGEADIQTLMNANEADPATPFRMDLTEKRVTWPGGEATVEVGDGPRQAFLEGTWDTTAELLAAKSAIEQTAAGVPYFSGWK